jgi:hypothetical protein
MVEIVRACGCARVNVRVNTREDCDGGDRESVWVCARTWEDFFKTFLYFLYLREWYED